LGGIISLKGGGVGKPLGRVGSLIRNYREFLKIRRIGGRILRKDLRRVNFLF